MDNMNLFNERVKKKDKLEKEDKVRIAEDVAESIIKCVMPIMVDKKTREGRTEELFSKIETNVEYRKPLQFLDQAFDLEELLLLQTCLSLKSNDIRYRTLDSLNGEKEGKLNFEARKRLMKLAPNIASKLLDVVRELAETPEEYTCIDLYSDVCFIVSYRYMRFYVDCSDNIKLEFKALQLGKFSVENNNGSAKINANFSLAIPKLFEYVCKLNERTKSYKETRL